VADPGRVSARPHGWRKERSLNGVLALREDELALALAKFGNGPRDERDRAMILLGFGGAFLRPTLPGSTLDDVRITPDAVRVHLRRSAEDQLGRGKYTDIPHGQEGRTVPPMRCARGSSEQGGPPGLCFASSTAHRLNTSASVRARSRVPCSVPPHAPDLKDTSPPTHFAQASQPAPYGSL
jgi:hypothetical protein